MKDDKKKTPEKTLETPETTRPRLTIEELEKRIAPTAIDKKSPTPPPYAPGTDYGLIRRDNLSW